ncbi:vacuolar associated sorting protein [Naegleria gruberi]|uniref:Vacuolar associated sorting protein n=1 Tax=Naegleria gruberi TaxID=5762 RepID=D2UZD1_NAEGR|nr:vacuolar associated sorting protein [Naegleria gruberi]EFC49928.1 vacuolar associated sorting protein [Naegleria gruberi]|eukprot:XP_002682672.1 vacuolar associated sorting protein [Naegleria gruberi strain NEG-M]
MFEGIASSIIVKLLGDYIENLDSKSLKIAVWSGSVNLTNLTLKASALDTFDLPISVVQGCVGSIDASIPWQSLSSSPVIAKVSDVFLVVQPKKCDKYDEQSEKARALLAKQRSLQNHELWKEQQEAVDDIKQDKKTDDKQGDTFVSRMTETILNNLQVEISNVHIRYEDGSNPKNRIVFGITMEKLSLKSCNENWEEVFIKTVQAAFYKKMLLQNLSFYMNNNEIELFSKSGMDTKKFSLHMKKIITENKFYRRFIVSPINGEAKLVMQKEGNIDMSKPTMVANLELDNVNLCLDDRQYKNLLSTLEYMSNYSRFERFRHLRPKTDYKSEEKGLWWEYLINSAKDIVEKHHFTWQQIEERKKQRKEYIELFKRSKEYPWQKKLSDSEKKTLHSLEDKIDFEDIIFYRELAYEELKIEKQKNKAFLTKNEKSSGWFGGWWGSKPSTATQESSSGEESPTAFEFTEEQREELHKTIGYNAKEKAQSIELPADYVSYQINFYLKQGELKLRNARVKSSDPDSAIVKGAFNNFRTEVGVRAQGSVIVRVTLDDFEITDHFSDVTQFKKILSRRKQVGHLAEIIVENKPLDGESDLKVQILLQQVDIALNVPLAQKILSFFIIPSNLDFSALQNLAKKQFESLQQQALTQLKVALESKMLIALDVLILAPTFIIPIDYKDENSKIVLLDLGKLKFKSDIDKKERERRIKNETVEEKDFYDRFDLELSNIQAVITDVPSYNKQTTTNSFQLIEKVNIFTKLGILITNDTNYAGTKIEGTIPSIKVNLSPLAMNTIVNVANNFLVLVDNPTGNSKEDVEIKGALKIKSDLLTNGEFKPYWTEVTENGKIMLYTTENDMKPSGCIYIDDRSIEYQLSDKNPDLTENQLAIVIPQESGPTTVIFEAESKTLLDKWFTLMSTKNVNKKLSFELSNNEKSHNEEEKQKNVKLKLNFNLGEFCASLIYNKKVGENEFTEMPLTDIKLQDFGVDMAIRHYDTIMNFSLKTFTISDKTTTATDKYILTSDLQSDKKLADLTLIQVSDPLSEHYKRNADLLLEFVFHKMLFNFDPMSLTTFLMYIYDVLDLTQKIEARVPTITPTEMNKKFEKRDKNRNSMDLHANLSEVSLALVQEDFSSFATATVADADVSFSMNDLGLCVKGTVGNLLGIDDSNDGTIYREIVGLSTTDQKSLITFSYIQNNERPENVAPTQPYYNKFLKLVLESVKIVYLNRVIVKLQHFMQNGPLWDALAAGGKKVSEYSKDSVLKQYESLELFSLDVKLVNPLVIAPMAYNNPDVIVGNLGEITVRNSLTQREDCWIELYAISFTQMNLHTITSVNNKQFVGGMDWLLDVERPVVNPLHKVPGVFVNIAVSDVAMNLTHEQYQMIFKVVDGNVNDNAGFSSSNEALTNETKKTEDKVLSESDAKITDLIVKVKFSNLNLTVLRTADDPLARLNMYDLNVDVNTKRNGLSVTKVSIHATDAHDLRKQSDSYFKTFVDTREEENSQHFINVDIYNDPEKSLVKVDVKMGNPRIIFVPDIVFEIQDFFVTMRPEKGPKGKILTYETMPSGDIHINSDLTLGLDLSLSPVRRLVVHKTESGVVEVDEGMILKLVNVKIKKQSDKTLEDYAELGEKAKISTNNSVVFVGDTDIEKEDKATIVVVSIDNPNVMFPVKPSDPNSRLMVLRSKLKFKMETSANKQSIVVMISEMTMFVDSFNSTIISKNNILEPLSLDFEYLSSTEPQAVHNDIKARIDGNVRSRISYQDVKMITEVVNHFTDAMSKSKKEEVPIAFEDVELSDDSGSESEEEEFSEAKDETEHIDGQFVLNDYVESRNNLAVIPTVEEKTNNKTTNFLFNFDMTPDQSVSILVVDDVRGYDIPLITFTMRKVHLIETKMTQLGDTSSIKAKLIGYIQADYYNLKIASWEPILEPYGIEFLFRRKPNTKSATPNVDRFEIRDLDIPKYKQMYHPEEFDGLLLNVTQSMITTVSSTAKLWKDEFYTETKVSKKFDPYCIRNHTGHIIKLIFPYNTQLQKADMYEIGTGQEMNFSLPEDKTKTAHHAITIDVPGFNKLQVELKQTGKLHIKNNKNEFCMVDNDLKEGRKIITISSGIQIRNLCTMDWEIGSLNISSKMITSFGIVNPKEYIGIPLTSVSEGILCMRPCIGEGYQWSLPSGGLKFTELLKLYKGSKNVTITNQKGPNMFAVVRTNFALDADYQQFREKYAENPLLYQRFYCTLDIKPPLAIDNTLGKTVDFTIIAQSPQSNERTVVQEGTMLKGEKLFVYSTEMNNNILIRVKVEKEWVTKELGLIHLAKRDGTMTQQSTHINIENSTGNYSRIYIDYSEVNTSAYREIILFSPFWIVNHTGENVGVRNSSTSNKPFIVPTGETLMYAETYDREKISITCNDSAPSPAFSLASTSSASMMGEGQMSDYTEEEEEDFNLFMLAEINQIGVSFIDNSPSEVAYLLLGGLTMRYATTDKHQFIECVLYKLQLDHQDYEATYPVILCNVNEAGQEFIHFSLCRSVENNTNVNTFPYMSLMMREARCEIDYLFISKFVKLIGILSTDQDQNNEADAQIAERMTKPVEIPKSEADAEKFYFENLELHPVKIHLTFKLNQAEDDSNPLLILFKSVGVTLTRIDNAPMRFNSLILSHPFMTLNALIDKVKKHYIRQATVQFYKILGSLDIIGNPVGLFSDIGTGVVDFFYEPASAITKSPEEFASGLAKGSMSLLKNSVHGIGNFTSKLTGNVGNGIAFLTFDKEYNQQRDRQANQKPKDIKEGLASGAKSLFRGIYGGATGIVMQPVKGAQEEGAVGFIKGVGKGIIGIPLKPVGGIIDMATRTVEGISNSSTTLFTRVRYPRTLADNGAVLRYSLTDAYAKYLTVSIDDGAYAKTNKAVYYMPDSTKAAVYLITDKFILKVDPVEKKVKWRMQLSKIMKVELVSEPTDAIKVVSNEREKSIFGTSGANITRLLDSFDKEYLHRFKNKLNIELSRVFKEQQEFDVVDY